MRKLREAREEIQREFKKLREYEKITLKIPPPISPSKSLQPIFYSHFKTSKSLKNQFINVQETLLIDT